MPRIRSLSKPRREASIREQRMKEIEEIRGCLPIQEYLMMLHEASITGKMPRFSFDPDNPRVWKRTTESDDLSTSQRLDVVITLVNKAMPDYKGLEIQVADAPSQDALIDASTGDTQTLRELDEHALRGIIQAANALIPLVPHASPSPAPQAREPIPVTPVRDSSPAHPRPPVDISVFFAGPELPGQAPE